MVPRKAEIFVALQSLQLHDRAISKTATAKELGHHLKWLKPPIGIISVLSPTLPSERSGSSWCPRLWMALGPKQHPLRGRGSAGRTYLGKSQLNPRVQEKQLFVHPVHGMSLVVTCQFLRTHIQDIEEVNFQLITTYHNLIRRPSKANNLRFRM